MPTGVRVAGKVLLHPLLLAAVLPAGSPTRAHAQPDCDPCSIGIVFDGPFAENDALRAVIEREITELASPRSRVVFPSSARRVADWTRAGVRGAVEALLGDPDVHILLTSGPLGSAHAATRTGLPKPVVAAFVLDPQAQGFGVETNAAGERISGTPNLAYITFSGDPAADIRQLQEVAPFRRLTYLVSEVLLTVNPAMEETLRAGMREAGGEATVVPVGASVEEALRALAPDSEAVYVTPLAHLSRTAFHELVDGLTERRLPAFSYLGRDEVDRGLLASSYLDVEAERLARRIALHVQRILLGEDAGELPVDFRRRRRLTINMATAAAIGVHPGWRVMSDAELLHAAPPEGTRVLSLASVTREALAVNLDLMAADRSVAAGQGAVRVARAALLPQVTASGGYERIDPDRAASTFGIQPEWSAAGVVGFSQVLYAESARARAAIERHAQTSREEAREEQRLDIVHDAALGYLNVLRALTFERIQRENLAVTRVNLEFAHSRREIGVARATEVLRWENQIANHRRAVLDAGAALQVARIALNRLLDRPLEEPFETTDVGLADPAVLASATLVNEQINNPHAFAILRDFMTGEALAASPELRQLDAGIAARERALVAAQRAFWAPVLTAGGEVTTVKSPETAGPFDFIPGSFTVPERDAINWSVGVSASLPLFSGGARWAERTRTREELAGLRVKRRAAAARMGARLRSALHFAAASYAGIGLAEEAAAAARRNLDLTTNAYEQGVVSILDLIDAQNTALIAEEGAADAVYGYLLDLMDAYRATGRLDAFLDPLDAAFMDRMRAFFREAGYEARPSR